MAPPKSVVVTPSPPRQNMVSVLKEGFSFGAGSAIAHRVVGGLFEKPVQKEPIANRNYEYEQCLVEHSTFIDGASLCAYLLVEAKGKAVSK
jgi:hypothetical protein